METRVMSRMAGAILRILVADDEIREGVEGDLIEDYARIRASEGSRSAARQYWCELLVSAPHLLRASLAPPDAGVGLGAAMAIVGGYVTLVALVLWNEQMLRIVGVRLDPENRSIMTLWLALDVFAGIGAGYVAAWLARRAPVASALALGLGCVVIGVLMALLGSFAGPLWYHVALQVVIVPATVTGGALRVRVSRRAPTIEGGP
jgi:hypothetical protein